MTTLRKNWFISRQVLEPTRPNSTLRIRGGCARAPSGQAAALPSSRMNSRRFTTDISRADRKNSTSGRLLQLRDFDWYNEPLGADSAVASTSAPACFV